ncbi:serum paraoxonase/arylesterase 2 isoform X2 [Callorhinchus milii]|nr:serum paraoxonase/arylesterase 2 isoform X2 [Callorhinchus milii]XP_007888992.1 serum paraoxonase/arylesterase 2 isoform X2 [Callorhinchus milii]|eukprot:gi/632947323/ref/XP_007888991.1/ PREDICTED: serum paraoxonase/arylesterase 2-like isoform X2 [Callorhinchus milii]
MGVFKEVDQIEPGSCHLIEGINYGSEDITVLPGGLALVSSGLKYPHIHSFAPDKPGQILLVNLNEPVLRAIELRLSRGFDVDSFNPHGISTYIHKDNTVYLFVVNHPQHTSTVEIFKFEEEQNSLTHLKTIRHELLHSVNDIVALGPDSFYATNDHYFSHDSLTFVELTLDLYWCNVIYYSPAEVKEVATGFNFANGINLSPDGKHVFVADVMDQSIHVMQVNPNKTLTRVKVLNVGTGVDNIEVDSKTGDVWVGCHPVAWKLISYNPEKPALSEVIRVQNILSNEPKVTQVYVNNGSVLQGSSVATVYEDKLLIGTIFHKAVYCELRDRGIHF